MGKWEDCEHDWQVVDHDYSDGRDAVKCTKCGCPGERSEDGTVFWPAT